MSTRPVQSNLPLFSHSIQQSLIFNGRLESTHKVFWLTLIPLEIKFETLESQKEDNRMACFVPFSNRNLDLSFFVFRPTVVLVDDFVDALKQFSLCTESLGCVQTSIFKSIHGNMVSSPLFLTSFQLHITRFLPFHFVLLFLICVRFT